MSVFVHPQGIKTVHAGDEGVKTWQNFVHVVVECPLSKKKSTCFSLIHFPNFLCNLMVLFLIFYFDFFGNKDSFHVVFL